MKLNNSATTKSAYKNCVNEKLAKRDCVLLSRRGRAGEGESAARGAGITSLIIQGCKFALPVKQCPAWILLVALTACGGNPSQDAPLQKWQGIEVRVESRPTPPSPGMNEFLVMATGEHGRPVYDMIVSLRTDDHDEWKQAIQDGQVGVYRRAAEVEPGTRSVLQVQIKHDGTESVLRFPLNLAR